MEYYERCQLIDVKIRAHDRHHMDSRYWRPAQMHEDIAALLQIIETHIETPARGNHASCVAIPTTKQETLQE